MADDKKKAKGKGTEASAKTAKKTGAAAAPKTKAAKSPATSNSVSAAEKKPTTKKGSSTKAAGTSAASTQGAAAKKAAGEAKAAAKPRATRRKAGPAVAAEPAGAVASSVLEVAEYRADVVAEAYDAPAAAPSWHGSPGPVYEPPTTIPRHYGVTQIELLVKDPHWLYAYWEVTPASWDQAREVLREVWDQTTSVLRLFQVDPSGEATAFFDTEIHGEAENWYLHVGRPNTSFYVALGLRGPGGLFYELARSSTVVTPSDSVSDVIAEEWARADIEFEELYRAAGEHHAPVGSIDFAQLMRQRMADDIASGALSSWMFSAGSEAFQHRARQRGFWFVVNTELVVYGATEPDATVTVQGHPIKLRPDGTFTLRFALPDGEQVIPCVAISADGIEKRTITPMVQKQTATSAPEIDAAAEAAFLRNGEP